MSEPHFETFSQRGLHNEPGRVLCVAREGRPLVLTNRGIPVGRIVPLGFLAVAMPIVRRAMSFESWAVLKPQPSRRDRPISRIMRELRGGLAG